MEQLDSCGADAHRQRHDLLEFLIRRAAFPCDRKAVAGSRLAPRAQGGAQGYQMLGLAVQSAVRIRKIKEFPISA